MFRSILVFASVGLAMLVILDMLSAQTCYKECKAVHYYQTAAGTTLGLCKTYGCGNNPDGSVKGHAPSNKFWAPGAVVANLADDGTGSVRSVNPTTACVKACPNEGFPQEMKQEGPYTLVQLPEDDPGTIQCKKCVTGS